VKAGGRRKECNSPDQGMAAGCILNGTRESKMEIPAKRHSRP
jgi:hypothetical protein